MNQWQRRTRAARAAGARGRWLPAAVLALLLCAGPAAQAQEAADAEGFGAVNVAEGALDVLVLRPLGILGVGTGSVFFLASAPFVAPGGHLRDAWDIFLYGPVEYTFVRPLGRF